MTRTNLLPDLLHTLPPALRRQVIAIPDAAYGNGVVIPAGRGSGKSRLGGRFIAYSHLLRGIPQVIVDPTGTISDNLIGVVWRKGKYCTLRASRLSVRGNVQR